MSFFAVVIESSRIWVCLRYKNYITNRNQALSQFVIKEFEADHNSNIEIVPQFENMIYFSLFHAFVEKIGRVLLLLRTSFRYALFLNSVLQQERYSFANHLLQIQSEQFLVFFKVFFRNIVTTCNDNNSVFICIFSVYLQGNQKVLKIQGKQQYLLLFLQLQELPLLFVYRLHHPGFLHCNSHHKHHISTAQLQFSNLLQCRHVTSSRAKRFGFFCLAYCF